MKFYFLTSQESSLASQDGALLSGIKSDLLRRRGHSEASNPEVADAIILHEPWSFKEWRYISRLVKDKVIGRYSHKVYTINTDDAANGLLKGIYTCLPKSRFNPRRHRAVPFAYFPNEVILDRRGTQRPEPQYLATWRGNPKSNEKLRNSLLETCRQSPAFLVETTESWLNHNSYEKERYVDLLLAGRFALCPAGWAAVSFRIYESMALGICPVIIADEYVHPLGPQWDNFSVQVPEANLEDLQPILEGIPDSYLEMGEEAQDAWEEYFCPERLTAYFADSLLSCIAENRGRGSAAEEVERWRSFETYWANGWTIPQRLVNRLNRLLKR